MNNLKEALKKLGIETAEQLNEAIKKEKPLDGAGKRRLHHETKNNRSGNQFPGRQQKEKTKYIIAHNG